MKNKLIVLTLVGASLALGFAACKKKSKHGGGAPSNDHLVPGLWISEGDAAKASVLQLTKTDYSGEGNGPLLTGCKTEQKYVKSGNTIVVGKTDNCSELIYTLESISESEFVAIQDGNRYKFNAASKAEVKDFFKSIGKTYDLLSDPFKQFADKPSSGNSTPTTTTNTGEFDNFSFEEFNNASYQLTLTQNIGPDQYNFQAGTLIPPRPFENLLHFQNGSILPDATGVSRNDGDVYCRFGMKSPQGNIAVNQNIVIQASYKVPVIQAYILYPETGSGVHSLTCWKYGAGEELRIGEIRQALGSYFTLSRAQ